MTDLRPEDGTTAFGADPALYDQARPPYPSWVYDQLRERCGLGPQTRAFEIGPGTGIATRELIARGLGSLVAIEPDQRLADFLGAQPGAATGRVRIQVDVFADAMLPTAHFDLGVAATVYHWLDPAPTLTKVVRSLRSGGFWAMWWNVFGNPRGDPFHEATSALMATIEPAQRAERRRPTYPLDTEARLSELAAAGLGDASFDLMRWTHPFDAEQTRALYATFPHISGLPPTDRQRVLAELGRIVDDEFAGLVKRPMLTPLYIARRP